MSQDLYTVVDNYLTETLIPPDPVMDAVLKSCDDAGLPPIAVTPTQGKFLQIMARTINAKRILEVGTLGGYSTIWLARALPAGGQLVTLEFSPKHADVAQENFVRANVQKSITIHVGGALDSFPKIAATKPQPFDLVFIDADKANNPQYFKWALKLTHPGSVIIIDNVVREGKVVDETSDDPDIIGTRQVLSDIANEPRVSATAIQTSDAKGHDGFAFVLVL